MISIKLHRRVLGDGIPSAPVRIRRASPMRRLTAAVALSVAACGAAAGAASAHTGATCIYSHANARCVGTIAGELLALGDNPVSLVIDGDHAQLSISVRPLIEILSSDWDVEAPLGCTAMLGSVRCAGTTEVDGESVAISTSGAIDGSSGTIRFDAGPALDGAQATGTAETTPTPTATDGHAAGNAPHSRRGHHHHRHHHQRRR